MYHWLCRNRSRISSMMNDALDSIPGNMRDKIRSMDGKHFILQILMAVVPISLTLYFAIFDTDQVVLTFRGVYSSDAELGIQLTIYAMTHFMFYIPVHFYVMVIVTCIVRGESLAGELDDVKSSVYRGVFLKSGHVFRKVQSRLQSFHFFTQEINSTLGVIPFCLFAYMFVLSVFGISFAFLKETIGVGFMYTILVVVFFNLTLMMFLVLYYCSKARNTFNTVTRLVRVIASQSLSDQTPFPVLESRRSLSMYLEQECHEVTFTAMSLFNLEPNVFLHFFNALVPFTVMFITTVMQLQTNNKDSQ